MSALGTRPLLVSSQLLRGALVGIGELVDRVVKPETDGLPRPETDGPARPAAASITIYSSARSERQG